MKKLALILGIVIIGFTSCKKDLQDPGGTSVKELSNEWFVTFTVDDQDVYGLGHVKIATYNTAANTNEIWVDDLGNSWDFKVKAQVDVSNLTFTATDQDNEKYAVKVNIANGKVLMGAGRSKSGNTTDSIYMEAKFSDDPRSFLLKGHSRTGFFEDEY